MCVNRINKLNNLLFTLIYLFLSDLLLCFGIDKDSYGLR